MKEIVPQECTPPHPKNHFNTDCVLRYVPPSGSLQRQIFHNGAAVAAVCIGLRRSRNSSRLGGCVLCRGLTTTRGSCV